MTARWNDLAQNLLNAAVGSGVDVDRSFIAPGPSFARDCRSIVVVLLRPSVVPLQREFAGGSCAIVPQLTFQVVFIADCVPAVEDDGGPPPSADLTAWSSVFLLDCNKIHDAVTDAAQNGTIGCDCDSISIGQGEMRGPLGLTASMLIPVTIQTLDETQF